MKSILIPTTYEADLTDAVATAIKQASGTHCTITILALTDAEDTYSAGYTLRRMQPEYTPAQQQVAEECRALVKSAENCRLNFRYQYGLTAPLLRNLMEFLGTDLIIITRSFRKEKQKLQVYCLDLLVRSKKPILQLSKGGKHTFSNALYIEDSGVQMDVRELHSLVNSKFNFKIVKSTKLQGQSLQALEDKLVNTGGQPGIDLLVETRRPSQKSSRIQAGLPHSLPILSIYEEQVKS